MARVYLPLKNMFSVLGETGDQETGVQEDQDADQVGPTCMAPMCMAPKVWIVDIFCNEVMNIIYSYCTIDEIFEHKNILTEMIIDSYCKNLYLDELKLLDKYSGKGYFLDLVQYFYSKGKGKERNDCRVLAWAVENGHMEVVKYLYERIEMNPWILRDAAEGGHVEVVKYLHECGEEFGEVEIDFAARKGHLGVVQYLHRIGIENSERAIEWAAGEGHLDIVKYLHECGQECTERAMERAAREGQLDIVKYLHNIGVPCTDYTMMNYTMRDDNIEYEMYRYLHSIWE